MIVPRVFFPRPAKRGEGAERRSREAGEGPLHCTTMPLTRLAALADLSPQAGRGKKDRQCNSFDVSGTTRSSISPISAARCASACAIRPSVCRVVVAFEP